MQPVPNSEFAGTEMHRSIMTAFCDVLRTTGLPPMTVMGSAASALGEVYKEVADQHRSGACPCGWEPNCVPISKRCRQRWRRQHKRPRRSTCALCRLLDVHETTV